MKIFDSGKKLHCLKNLYLRLKDGAGCCDTYSYAWWVSGRLAREIKLFKERNTYSYPSCLKNMEEWKHILNEIIWSLEYIKNEDVEDDLKSALKNSRRCNRGMKLFGKYFRNLWY